MGFDVLALAAVRQELAPLVLGGQIQKLAFTGPLSLGLGVYVAGVGRTDVLLTAEGDAARVHVVPTLPPRGIEHDSPFVLLARKHLRHARIRGLVQPPWERVLEWEIEQHTDAGEVYRLRLIVEAMGRRGNLVLVAEDGSILDAARRSPPSRNARRPVLPHLRYEPPPPQLDRLAPDRLDASALQDKARGRGGALAAFLGNQVAGLSPLAAREIAYRATGSAEAPLLGAPWQEVAAVAEQLVAPALVGGWATNAGDPVEVPEAVWQPTLIMSDEGLVDYASFQPTHQEAGGLSLERAATMSAAIQTFYGDPEHSSAGTKPRGDPQRTEKAAVRAALEARQAGMKRRLAALEREVEDLDRADGLRRAGEALLTYSQQVPLGVASAELGGQTIVLDPTLNAVENAQAYFAQYRKVRDAGRLVPKMIEEEHTRLKGVEELLALVEVADTPEALRALRRESQEVASPKEPSHSNRGERSGKPQRPSAPYRTIALDAEWGAWVGSSAAGNVMVTFERAAGDDLWLHARGVPGAHVALHGPRGSVPPAPILERAAGLAAWFSAARTEGQVEVDYTASRLVKKVARGFPGQVTYSGEQTVRVRPCAPEVFEEREAPSGIIRSSKARAT